MSLRPLAAVVLLCCAALMVALGPRQPPNLTEGSRGVSAARIAHGLRLELRVRLSGRALVIEMSVENQRDEPVALWSRTSQMWDAEVSDGQGHLLWRWSADKLFLQAITTCTLRPGERMGFRAEWEAPGPGRYVVTGYLLAHVGSLDGPIVEPVGCTIEVH